MPTPHSLTRPLPGPSRDRDHLRFRPVTPRLKGVALAALIGLALLAVGPLSAQARGTLQAQARVVQVAVGQEVLTQGRDLARLDWSRPTRLGLASVRITRPLPVSPAAPRILRIDFLRN